MNKSMILGGAAAFLLAATATRAADAPRGDLTGAAGACVPTMPTDKVQYRVGGMRNAGAEDIYVICGMIGDWRNSDDPLVSGSTAVYIRVTNTDTVTRSTQCTLHAGYSNNSTSTTQGAFAKSYALPPTSSWQFDFPASLLESGNELATSTFICRLPRKSEIVYVLREYKESIGT